MTAIAALRYDNGVILGGDSAGVGGYYLHHRQDPKVFAVGKLLVGYTSSFRMAQLIRFGWVDCLAVADLAPPESPDDGFEFMCREFVPRVRYIFQQGGYLRNESGREEGGNFIVAWGRQFYEVQPDLQVAHVRDDYTACGCGIDLCLGALHQSDRMAAPGGMREGSRERAEFRVDHALAAAERFSAGVRSPFIMMSTEDLPGGGVNDAYDFARRHPNYVQHARDRGVL